MTKRDNDWLRVQLAEGDQTTADLFLLGFIGDWIDDLFEDWGFGFDSVKTAKKFQGELDALPESVKTLRLRVNSPGGDVFGAVAIANMLRDQRTTKGRVVIASVEGLAASAASIVIQAGDPVRIADNGLIMIHDPYTKVVGNARELRKAADELDEISEASIIGTYRWHSELSTEEIAALMAETTWMDADEAIENGFATEKVEGLEAAAALDARALSVLDVPEKYRERVEAMTKTAKQEPPKDSGRTARFLSRVAAAMRPDDDKKSAQPTSPASHEEIIGACSDAGLDLAIAQDLISARATQNEVEARVEKEKSNKAAAEARARDIRALCQAAELPELAAGYIDGAMSVDVVKAQLTTLTARLDGVEIDGRIDPDGGRVDAAESWKNAFANARRGWRRK